MGNVWSNAAESNLRETVMIASDGSLQDRTPGRISGAIVSERAKGKWHISSIPVPALLIFAHNSWTEMMADLSLDTRDGEQKRIRALDDETQKERNPDDNWDVFPPVQMRAGEIDLRSSVLRMQNALTR